MSNSFENAVRAILAAHFPPALQAEVPPSPPRGAPLDRPPDLGGSLVGLCLEAKWRDGTCRVREFPAGARLVVAGCQPKLGDQELRVVSLAAAQEAARALGEGATEQAVYQAVADQTQVVQVQGRLGARLAAGFRPEYLQTIQPLIYCATLVVHGRLSLQLAREQAPAPPPADAPQPEPGQARPRRRRAARPEGARPRRARGAAAGPRRPETARARFLRVVLGRDFVRQSSCWAAAWASVAHFLGVFIKEEEAARGDPAKAANRLAWMEVCELRLEHLRAHLGEAVELPDLSAGFDARVARCLELVAGPAPLQYTLGPYLAACPFAPAGCRGEHARWLETLLRRYAGRALPARAEPGESAAADIQAVLGQADNAPVHQGPVDWAQHDALAVAFGFFRSLPLQQQGARGDDLQLTLGVHLRLRFDPRTCECDWAADVKELVDKPDVARDMALVLQALSPVVCPDRAAPPRGQPRPVVRRFIQDPA